MVLHIAGEYGSGTRVDTFFFQGRGGGGLAKCTRRFKYLQSIQQRTYDVVLVLTFL